MKSFRAIVVLLALAACVVLAGVALAGKGSSKPEKRVPSTKLQQSKPVVKTAKTAAKPARKVSRATGATKSGQSAGDTDNIQSGDQTTPDTADEQSTESDSESNDNEAGQAGEPAQGQGHEDPAGEDVNHECTGNCQE